MVGDPRQLPPTVTSREAQRLGLGFSLFERVQAMGATTCLLDTQYRMHPKLAEFPSVKFYKGLLQSWPRPEDRLLPDGLQWPNPQVCEMAAVM
jgi:regulator of nonsense transcripts 1